jgi:hypothetical protein
MSTESITPLSRDQLKQMNAAEDQRRRLEKEANRLKEVKRYVDAIYIHVLKFAKKSTDTQFQINYESYNGINLSRLSYGSHKYDVYLRESQFWSKNMEDIIKGLKELFPDSSVECKDTNTITIDWS